MKIEEIKMGGIYRIAKGKEGQCSTYEHNFDVGRSEFIEIRAVDTSGSGHLVYFILDKDKSRIDSCSGCFSANDLEPEVKASSSSKVKLTSVIISPEKTEQIRAAISQPQFNDKIFNEWGFGEVFEKGTAVSLLFYGVPGTGKTLMAQAIADDLGQDLKILNTADIESSEPGGAERAIKGYFEEAGKKYEESLKGRGKAQVLLFDECDSLLTDRNQVGVILAAQVNALLTELERFKGVVIFTTNRLGKLDPAVERRITAKIEFEFPNKEYRLQIWKRMIPEKAPIHSDVAFIDLAEFPMTGGNIKNVVLNAARKAAYRKQETIDMMCFLESVENELKGMQQFDDEQKKATRQAVQVGGGGLQRVQGGLKLDKRMQKGAAFAN
jgi:AAA+ superfamily predicted ATPase